MYCRGQLVELQKDYGTITDLGAEILAVSPDDLSGAGWVIDELGLEFPVLYDEETTTIQEYGIFIPSTGLPAPSTFVLDKTGEIRWSYIGHNLTDRPLNQQIIEELRKLN